MPDDGYGFDLSLPNGGYAWWYVDALSDDGRHGVTVIAFIGSVFSPYYAWRRRRQHPNADPYDHVAINVALYGADGYRWAMTERGRRSLHRSATELSIGSSRLAWSRDGGLMVDLDEIAIPLPRRIRGQLRVRPGTKAASSFALDGAARHLWRPIAPCSRIEVEWAGGERSWSGSAYVDHNRGSEPLEAAFESWSWSRSIESGETRIFYDVTPKSGGRTAIAIRYDAGFSIPTSIDAPPVVDYATSLWRIPLSARADDSSEPRLIESWEDGPFYSRALIDHTIDGTRLRSVHETLSLQRFRQPIVQAMLPFRMPRRP